MKYSPDMGRASRIIVAVMILVASVACGPGGGRAAETTTPPLVIFVSIDTLRPDHLGCYGYPKPTSPEIDVFAAQATLFENVLSHAPATLWSHASMFTSRVPQHHGVIHSGEYRLAEEANTLAEVMQRNGYHTAAFTAGGQLSQVYGLDQGFDLYEVVDAPGFAGIVKRAFEWLDSSPSRPYLLFLHTYEPHHPYIPNPDDLKELNPDYSGDLPPYTSIDLIMDINGGRRNLGPGDLEHIEATYDGGILETSRAFGELVTGLQKRGIFDEALVIFTADHGEEFAEHGKVGWHSHTLYDELLKVPLIVKFPNGEFSRRRVDDTVQLIDLAPTVLDEVGLAIPDDYQGSPLRRTILEGSDADRPAVAFMPNKGSIRVGRWKMVGDALFDLTEDPAETRNLANEHPEVMKDLRARYDEYLARLQPLDTVKVALDEKTEDQLKALGYLVE